ncbi:CoA transferase [Pseudooceanicola aestuarii]|uniref:CoA transferase n=1 Tax=Pseudooceanicola aestuarii TaxID=2697319 RepID=UPI0013D016A4|nr:CoA transferase [Pseudooceanicola aestuarii]
MWRGITERRSSKWPPAGDETGGWKPPFQDGTAAYFEGLHRISCAIAPDLVQSAGREGPLRLLKGADILIENLKVGTPQKWGLSDNDGSARPVPVQARSRERAPGAARGG